MSKIESYADAEAFFASKITRSRTYLGSVKAVRLPEGNTVLRKTWDFERQQYGYAVRFHDTDVVTYWADGSVSVATGGWLTVTTLDRLSTYTSRTAFSFDAKVYYHDNARRYLIVYGSHTEIFYPGQTGARRFAA